MYLTAMLNMIVAGNKKKYAKKNYANRQSDDIDIRWNEYRLLRQAIKKNYAVEIRRSLFKIFKYFAKLDNISVQ